MYDINTLQTAAKYILAYWLVFHILFGIVIVGIDRTDAIIANFARNSRFKRVVHLLITPFVLVPIFLFLCIMTDAEDGADE